MTAVGKKIWGIHTMDDPLFLNQNLVAIGWEEMGDLSKICPSRNAYGGLLPLFLWGKHRSF